MRSQLVIRSMVVAACVVALSLPALLAQQPTGATPQQPPVPTEGTAAISGVVTDATTNQPIPGVMVYLGFQGRGAVGRLSRQISDGKGRFVFTDLPAGDLYFINASKFGYLDGHFGVGAGGLLGGMMRVTDGQWFAEANVTMQRPGSISGRIVDERGDPAVGAFVRVLVRMTVAGQQRLAAGPVTKTDDRGMYHIPQLPPGRYLVQVPQVQASLAGSITAQDLSGVTAEQIAAGRPVPDPPVSLSLADGTRLIVGGYLPPPPPVNGRPHTYPPLFHPGVTSISAAAAIDLRAGEDRTAINVALQSVPATSISGVVEGPGGMIAGTHVRLLADGLEGMGTGSEIATATVGSDGRFSLVNIPAGSYTIDVRRTVSEFQYRPSIGVTSASLPYPPGPSGAGGGTMGILTGPSGTSVSYRNSASNVALFAQQKVTVDTRPLTDLVVMLKRGGTIRGRMVMESGEAPPPMQFSGYVTAEPADGNAGNGIFQSGSPRMLPAGEPPPTTFEIQGIAPGRYVLRFSVLPGDGAIKSIQADDGVDYTVKAIDMSSGRDYDVVVTVTLAKRPELSGMAVDANGAHSKNAVVIAFPVDREQWSNYGLNPTRLRASPANSTGTYRFQSLVAGDYYVVGVPPDQSDVWQDPAKLAQLVSSARRVKLTWGDVTTQDVVVVRVK